jgi:hypothetical protein
VPEAIVARYPEGLRARTRLELSGEPPWVLKWREGIAEIAYQPFAINWLDRQGNILFHFNPRPAESLVVLNSWFDGTWNEPVFIPGLPFQLERDIPFRLRFDVNAQRISVSVNGSSYCEFKLESDPSSISEVRASAFFWRLRDSWSKPMPRFGFHPYGEARAADVVHGSWVGWEQGWVDAQPNPARPSPLASPRLFAIVGAWMEEDVIEATVRNCTQQGCERVYLVDNASPDRTVERAVAAGAQLAATYDTGRYDELERIRRMQAVVDTVSDAEGDEHIWWLWLDADEFHHGPRGLTLHEYLATLDRSFRVVGARFLNHFPTSEPAYVEGHNPLEFQPICYEQVDVFCDLGHRKHPLVRWDRDAPPIQAAIGFHTAHASGTLLEPTEPVVAHHFPFRCEAATRRRLAALFGQGEAAATRIPDGDSVSALH